MIIMSGITWVSLPKPITRGMSMWCLSGVILGFGLILLSLRGSVSNWITYPLANFIIVYGSLIRVQSLRMELNSPWRPSLIATIAILIILIFEFLRLVIENAYLRLEFMLSIYFLLFAYSAYIAWQLSKVFKNHSAIWISIFHGLLASVLLLRLIEVIHAGRVPDGVDSSLANFMIAIAGTLLAIISHISYVGMKLEQKSLKVLRAEQQYRAILRTTADGFFITTDKGIIIDVNENFCNMVGFTRKQLLQNDINKFLDMNFEQVDDSNGNMIVNPAFVRYESRLVCSVEKYCDVDVSVTYMENQHNNHLVFVRDISERNLIQSELKRLVSTRSAELATARAEAEAANAVKTQFMSNVSHEMRTPMQSILGYAEIGKLNADQENANEHASYFEHILASGHRLNKLLESLLSLADDVWNDFEAVLERNSRTIALDTLANRSVVMMESIANKRQQKIDLECISQGTYIHGDETQLQQILEYLLGNALRYSPESSTVTLRLSEVIQNSGSLNIAGEKIVIQVIDQGCGIPEQELDAIFEPFYQSSRTDTGEGGTGLGLALCRVIVNRHKGIISAQNREEGGAILSVVLPKVKFNH